MHRRQILKGMVALPAVGLMRACQNKYFQAPSRPQPAQAGSKLGIILQGPFTAVLRKDKGYRVTAFVPKTGRDDPTQHEFRLGSPESQAFGACAAGYQLTLPPDGLNTTSPPPPIDRGFDNVTFSVEQWVPDRANYFVMLELPKPDAVRYKPPLYAARFETSYGVGSRLGSVPLNVVLEYGIQNANDIVLKPKQTSDCGLAQTYHPLSTKEALEEYDRYQSETRDQGGGSSLSQAPYVRQWLAQYTHLFFLEVGIHLTPGTFSEGNVTHGVSFYNERVLPAIYQNQPIPPGAKLIKIGGDVCSTAESASAGIRPAVWQYSTPQALFRPIAMNENCCSAASAGKG